MALIRTILIFILIYYAFRVITRFILPYFAKRWVQKAQENFQRQQGYVDPEESKKREGEVKVNPESKSTSNKDGSKKDLGDYVDFEEINEEN
mgnify:CR=1 FL=1